MKSLYLIVALICLVSVISATPVCKGCAGTSSGPCKNPSNNVCYDYQTGTDCYSGTNECPDEGTYYSCIGGTCAPNATGIFPTEAICKNCCQHCTGCEGDSEGNCMDKTNNVCHYYNDFNHCQSGEEYCFPESCKRYECASNGACSQSLNGTYYSMDTCSSACGATSTMYACNNGNCEASASGTYVSMAICESDCTVDTKKYACNSGVCSESTAGTYTSMDECKNACTSTATKYACNSGVCSESTTGYDSMSDCTAACSSTGGRKTKCNLNTCFYDPSGSYDSLADCQATCMTGTVACTGCNDNSSGMCISETTHVCYDNDPQTGHCPSQMKPCHASEEEFLGY